MFWSLFQLEAKQTFFEHLPASLRKIAFSLNQGMLVKYYPKGGEKEVNIGQYKYTKQNLW